MRAAKDTRERVELTENVEMNAACLQCSVMPGLRATLVRSVVCRLHVVNRQTAAVVHQRVFHAIFHSIHHSIDQSTTTTTSDSALLTIVRVYKLYLYINYIFTI